MFLSSGDNEIHIDVNKQISALVLSICLGNKNMHSLYGPHAANELTNN